MLSSNTSDASSNRILKSVSISALSSPHFTPSGMRLTLVKPGSGFSWLFFPGGPGLGSEYLSDLAENLPVKGSVWLLDYPGIYSNGALTMESWKKGVLESLNCLSNPVPVCHSFGGMLLLATSGVRERIKGLVLMSTSPDERWATGIDHTAAMTPEMREAEAAFTANPTDESFASYFEVMAPYYFVSSAVGAGRELFARTKYNAAGFSVGGPFASTYAAAWLPDVGLPTLLMAGAEDKVTPLWLFDQCSFLSSSSTQVANIPHAGHFPWIENPSRVLREFEDFDRSLHR